MPRKPRPVRPWFRFYTEAVCSDPKIRRLPVKDRWLWVAVLAAARQSPVPGRLLVTETEPFSNADLADFAGVPVRDVRTGTALLASAGLITRGDLDEWVVVKWAERQFEGDHRNALNGVQRERILLKAEYACAECGATDDLQVDHVIPVAEGGSDDDDNLQILCGLCHRKKTNRLRQQRFRARHNGSSALRVTASVTPLSRDVTPPETDTENRYLLTPSSDSRGAVDNPEQQLIDQAVKMAARRYGEQGVQNGGGRSVDALATWWLKENPNAGANAANLLAEYDLQATTLADALLQPNPAWLRNYRRRATT